MPTKRRIGKARGLDDYKRQQLLEGPDAVLLAGVGYLAPYGLASLDHLGLEERGAVLATMRAEWAIFGPDLMAWWRSGEPDTSVRPWTWVPAGSPDRDPWALREFGEP